MTVTHAGRVIGMRFKRAEAVAYFDPGELRPEVGDKVVVDTTLGPDLGTVVSAPGPLVHRDPMVAVRPALRMATEEDLAKREQLKVREAEALTLARTKARHLRLPMKISAARIPLDERKILLEFAAEERIELRDLYRRLTDALHSKVELRSIGPRDEAKNLGGLGRCGLEMCCSRWLDKFDSVTVKMAKEQGLPISAEGLAGQCGRLKCCLRFEYEQYRAANRLLPRIGERVMTAEGLAKVIVGHPLKGTVSVIPERRRENDFMRTVELPIDQIERLPDEHRKQSDATSQNRLRDERPSRN